MADFKRNDYPALYENGKGQYLIVPDWRSGPVGFFRSKKSLEEYEAEIAAAQARAIERNLAEAAEREERAREEGAAVRAEIQAREKRAAEAAARRKKQEPSPSASEPAADTGGGDAAGEASPDPANALAGWAAP